MTKLCARCGKSGTDGTHAWDPGSPETDDCHEFIENLEPRSIDITDLIRIGHLVATMAGTDGFCSMCDVDQNGGCHQYFCPCFGLDPKTTYDDMEAGVEEIIEAFDDDSCGDPSCENCGVELDEPVTPKKTEVN